MKKKIWWEIDGRGGKEKKKTLCKSKFLCVTKGWKSDIKSICIHPRDIYEHS